MSMGGLGESGQEFAERGESVFFGFGGGFFDESNEVRGDRGIVGVQRREGSRDVLLEDAFNTALEREDAGEHFEGGDAEGVDISAVIDGLPHDLFGSHIRGRTFGLLRALFFFVFGGLDGETKVADFDVALVVHQQVGGFDIAVDDAVFVGVMESGSGLIENTSYGVTRKSCMFFKERVEIATLDHLHDQEDGGVGFFDVVESDDMGVLELGEDQSFAEETLAEGLVVREFVGEHFESDGLSGVLVLCGVDKGGGSCTDLAEDVDLSDVGNGLAAAETLPEDRG